jgi:hypothetical protein
MVGSIGDGEPQVELSLRSGKGELTLRRASGIPARATPPAPASPAWPAPPASPRAPAPPAAPASGHTKPTRGDSTLSILEALARGEITPAEAEDLLSSQ